MNEQIDTIEQISQRPITRDMEIIEEIHIRQNVIEELAKLLVERLWIDKAGEFQHLHQRFELAAFASGIMSASRELQELFINWRQGIDE